MTKPEQKRKLLKWSNEEKDALKILHGQKPRAEIAKILGRSDSSVRGMLEVLGLNKREMWSDDEVKILTDHYKLAGSDGFLGLQELAEQLGRDKANICRKAKSIGLDVSQTRQKVKQKKQKNKYKTKEEAKNAFSSSMRLRLAEKGHPKGMLGKKHSEESLKKISLAAVRNNAARTDVMKVEYAIKAAKTKIENGTYAMPRHKTTWKADWREIGGQRKFYRSRWEANYARYLQFLKEKGQIQDWKHEPKTFWFKDVKRGTVSYLPDFWVMENNNLDSFHEVKGWMDDRSATKIKRMAKYYPDVKLVVIREKQYKEIKAKLSKIIDGWEE